MTLKLAPLLAPRSISRCRDSRKVLQYGRSKETSVSASLAHRVIPNELLARRDLGWNRTAAQMGLSSVKVDGLMGAIVRPWPLPRRCCSMGGPALVSLLGLLKEMQLTNRSAAAISHRRSDQSDSPKDPILPRPKAVAPVLPCSPSERTQPCLAGPHLSSNTWPAGTLAVSVPVIIVNS